MSHQCLADAFAPAEARYREQVFQSTWGHLAPKRNKKYHGFIVFAIGCYGNDELNPTVLACEFTGLDDSPWFYEAITEFLGKPQWNVETKRYKVGSVYRFDGIFRNYVFDGTVKEVLCTS